jgi:hypothetical protein
MKPLCVRLFVGWEGPAQKQKKGPSLHRLLLGTHYFIRRRHGSILVASLQGLIFVQKFSASRENREKSHYSPLISITHIISGPPCFSLGHAWLQLVYNLFVLTYKNKKMLWACRTCIYPVTRVLCGFAQSLYNNNRKYTKSVGVYRTWPQIEPSSLYSLRDKRKKAQTFL